MSAIGASYISLLIGGPLSANRSSASDGDGAGGSTTPTKQKKAIDLFKVKDISKVSYYEALNVPMAVDKEEVKRAYHKACLLYHPDKTGRGEDDEVFLLIKKAFDTLTDTDKKRAYDSTCDFDDRIPKEGEGNGLGWDAFSKLFSPVFERNMRFAVLKEAPRENKNRRASANAKVDPNAPDEKKRYITPPTIGDDETPVDEVTKFYDYWVNFESWRDFTYAASKQTEHNLDNAEGRDEKRWMMKEVQKKLNKMKADEILRVAALTERAMNADPRLRRHNDAVAKAKADVKEAKEKLIRDAADKEKNDKEAALKDAEDAEEIRKLAAANLKFAKEKEKKLVRNAKKLFRAKFSEAFNEASKSAAAANWKSLSDMNDECEFLVEKLTLDELAYAPSVLGETEGNCDLKGLQLVRDLYVAVKAGAEVPAMAAKAKQASSARNTAQAASAGDKAAVTAPFSKGEKAGLVRAVKAIGTDDWNAVAVFVNDLLNLPVLRSAGECDCEHRGVPTASSDADVAASTAALAAASLSSSSASAAPAASVAEKAAAAMKAAAAAKEADKAAKKAPPTPPAPQAAKVGGGAWIAAEDKLLGDMLKKYPGSMDKNERWDKVAEGVATRTKKECVDRFKQLKEELAVKK